MERKHNFNVDQDSAVSTQFTHCFNQRRIQSGREGLEGLLPLPEKIANLNPGFPKPHQEEIVVTPFYFSNTISYTCIYLPEERKVGTWSGFIVVS